MDAQALRLLARGLPYVCLSCRRRAQTSHNALDGSKRQTKRFSRAASKREARPQAEEEPQAEHYASESRKPMLQLLEERGLLHQVIGKKPEFEKLLEQKRVGVYLGIDPTAPSMHVGNLVPLMALFWMYSYSYPTYSLLGGATVKIGDPSGRTSARDEKSPSENNRNMLGMRHQLRTLWDHAKLAMRRHQSDLRPCKDPVLLDNQDWLHKTQLMEVLCNLAPGMRLGTMLGRDSVKLRMERGDGMSLAEFLYPMMQAWDWWHLLKNSSVQVQIGGSDQFGNILAGADGINHMCGRSLEAEDGEVESDALTNGQLRRTPFGFTTPLLTTPSGEKFGKSAGNAVWLDKDLTTPFDLYQYFLRIPDDQVHRYLKLLTFEPLEDLDGLINRHYVEPSQRLAQHRLAKEVTALAHGMEVANQTESEHRTLFQSPVSSSSTRTPVLLTDSFAKITLTVPHSLLDLAPNYKILYYAGLTSTTTEAHTIGKAGGAYYGSVSADNQLTFHQLNIQKLEDIQDKIVHLSDEGALLILRIGKRKTKVLRLVAERQFVEEGYDFPHSGAWWGLPGNQNWLDVREQRGRDGQEVKAQAAKTKAQGTEAQS